ncbi:hypothetical protein IPC1343_03480 [Pseudomonas aeruginosa]|uniref:Cro/CI family transcriptional regulator n=1 Tax=Pseudomonas aeruginosa TaxID=287 RepID=UPI00106743F5|nr:Cro/CI family transcriptional regulator [Pseudomonas aeruginosa]TEG22478.1 hypothetical protein IPC1343_03480 [Pseudomonas aeruginosa]
MTKTQALAYFKSTAAIADALRISYQAVHQWQAIPPLRQLQLERISRGELQADPVAGAGSADLEPILPSGSHIRQCADTAVQASSTEVAQ